MSLLVHFFLLFSLLSTKTVVCGRPTSLLWFLFLLCFFRVCHRGSAYLSLLLLVLVVDLFYLSGVSLITAVAPAVLLACVSWQVDTCKCEIKLVRESTESAKKRLKDAEAALEKLLKKAEVDKGELADAK